MVEADCVSDSCDAADLWGCERGVELKLGGALLERGPYGEGRGRFRGLGTAGYLLLVAVVSVCRSAAP